MNSHTVVAFPGAEGFGASAKGGRGGRVIEVVTLDDRGAGSLRAALEAAGPRIVVFRTGGLIELATPITISEPFVTLAGQSAPGDGIALKGEGIIVAAPEVIVRGIRIRIGDLGVPSCCRDALTISTTKAVRDIFNVIVDHSSFSWSIDEAVSTWRSSYRPHTIGDITIQWSIVSEALDDSIHVDEGDAGPAPHGMGMLIGRNAARISVHHNLLAHNRDRNPRVMGVQEAEVIDNLIYSWGDGPIKTSDMLESVHIWNNYAKAGASSRELEIQLHDSPDPGSRYAIRGNLADDPRTSQSLFDARLLNRSDFPLSSGPVFAASGITLHPTRDVHDLVLGDAGARAPRLDPVDARIVDGVRTRSGGIIDSQEEVGGWPAYAVGVAPADADHDGMPDAWETARGLDPHDPKDRNGMAPSGYTWIEEYVNSLIATGPLAIRSD